MTVEVKERLFKARSAFQEIEVIDTEAFGRMLLLDGHVQLAQLDEGAYHEALVHIPLLSVSSPERALVVGGGDGGVLRELCKHKALKQVDMVEIDQLVIDACREHLPFVSGGAFDDPRVSVYVEDAFGFLKKERPHYDLIVMDVTDIYEDEEGELSERLFSDEFYGDCRKALSEKGFLVSQADNHVFCPYSLEAVMKTFQRIFDSVGSYQALVPSFGGFSAYCWGSRSGGIAKSLPANKLPLRYLDATTYSLALKPTLFSL
jgi:spermidine synthase